jgi:hypothetical protein
MAYSSKANALSQGSMVRETFIKPWVCLNTRAELIKLVGIESYFSQSPHRNTLILRCQHTVNHFWTGYETMSFWEEERDDTEMDKCHSSFLSARAQAYGRVIGFDHEEVSSMLFTALY